MSISPIYQTIGTRGCRRVHGKIRVPKLAATEGVLHIEPSALRMTANVAKEKKNALSPVGMA